MDKCITAIVSYHCQKNPGMNTASLFSNNLLNKTLTIFLNIHHILEYQINKLQISIISDFLRVLTYVKRIWKLGGHNVVLPKLQFL